LTAVWQPVTGLPPLVGGGWLLVGAAEQPGHDLGDPGGVAWGRSLGCRPVWGTATVKRPFGELGPALAWRDDLREMAARSTAFGLADKGKNFWFRGCIRRPMGHRLGQRRVPPYAARRRFARSLSVLSGRPKDKGKEISPPCHF
jgi:hypothetical protein